MILEAHHRRSVESLRRFLSLWLASDAATWDLASRYINFEDPWLRTAIGFDSRDVHFGLAAGPDGDDWEWKDKEARLARGAGKDRPGARGQDPLRG
jgi:hypothetical protein